MKCIGITRFAQQLVLSSLQTKVFFLEFEEKHPNYQFTNEPNKDGFLDEAITLTLGNVNEETLEKCLSIFDDMVLQVVKYGEISTIAANFIIREWTKIKE
jgi:hypothetical protein